MHVKRFYQATVREALAEVRAQLGADALVLSTELVPAPGWRGWLGTRVARLTAERRTPDASMRSLTPDPQSASRPAMTTHRHRVLAADTPAPTARRAFDRYAPFGPSCVVITKLDERDTATLASLAAAPLRDPATEEHSCH